MSLNVFIPTAGTGSRLGILTKNLNKSLITVGNKPIISHIIDNYPANTNFVIALGFKGEVVKQYLDLVYDKYFFKYVYVKNFTGPSSSLTHTLYCSQKHLYKNFIFHACDTIISKKKFITNKNWVGFADKNNLNDYRYIEIKKSKVLSFKEKGYKSKKNLKIYIGVAGIKNFIEFWKEINKSHKIYKKGEIIGLESLIKNKIYPRKFKWHDTGNLKSLEKAKNFYKKNSINILDKNNESIFFVKNYVVKFFQDKKIIRDRVKRSKNLKGFVPSIIKYSKNFYIYRKVKGKIFSDKKDLITFKKLLIHINKFHKIENLKKKKFLLFKKTCLDFYKKKTIKRITNFYKINKHVDNQQIINNTKVPKLKKLLSKIDWKDLSNGIPGRFHGDLHFENIIVSSKKKFTFLDWRQNFGSNLNTGDIYYDYAKILHGLIVSHKIVTKKKFKININKNKVYFNIIRPHHLKIFENYFFKWLKENNLDVYRVKILTSLIFLNICSLHHYPYNNFLFYLGKLMLYKTLNEKD